MIAGRAMSPNVCRATENHETEPARTAEHFLVAWMSAPLPSTTSQPRVYGVRLKIPGNLKIIYLVFEDVRVLEFPQPLHAFAQTL